MDKVGASQTSGVARVNDNRLVAKVVWRAGVRGEVELGELGDEWGGGDVTVLASEVTCLAGLRGSDFTWVVLAAISWVEMAEGGCAVTVGWDC